MNIYKRIAEKVIGELAGRKGFDNFWDKIDEDVRKEIIDKITEIITTEFITGCNKE